MEKNEFLKLYPWPAEFSLAKKVEWFWNFLLDSPREELWPHLIDTSAFNKLLGLPEMQYQEINGRLYGKNQTLGFRLEWEEVPWEWEYLKGLNNARIYKRGFARYVRAYYVLEEKEGKTNLVVYFGWIARGILGYILLKLSEKPFRKNYQKALAKILEIIKTQKDFSIQTRMVHEAGQREDVKLNVEFWNKLCQETIARGANPDIMDFFAKYLAEATEEELYRIRLRDLEKRYNLDFYELVKSALLATQTGLFSLSYDIICPHCRGVRQEIKDLGDIPEEARCEPCDITFGTQDIDRIEIIFHLNPAVRSAKKRFFCAAEPAQKRHIFISRKLNPLETITLNTELPEGSYLLYFRGEKNKQKLLVSSVGEEQVNFSLNLEPKTAKVKPQIVVKNPYNKETYFLLEQVQDFSYLRPRDLFSLQIFRDIFPQQALATGLKLEVGKQCIFFSDIVGSTKFYQQKGDAEAFAKVREHFVVIYQAIRKNKGAVVKTIGDAVMAAFATAENALQASLEIQKIFMQDTVKNLRLRISLHYGDCLAVNLNTGIDYFGRTVNSAAKLQSLVGENEILFSDEVLQQIKNFPKEYQLEEIQTELVPSKKAYRLQMALRPN